MGREGWTCVRPSSARFIIYGNVFLASLAHGQGVGDGRRSKSKVQGLGVCICHMRCSRGARNRFTPPSLPPTGDSSSKEFFASLDTNLDGTVQVEEMISHVTGFGGKSLDEPEEISRGVRSAFELLDENNDGTLTAAESNRYWSRLGAVLSVNEVADWVEHGVQLPAHVADAFRMNAVTGYDFAELIELDGQALSMDLGIDRAVYKKKLVRSMQMLLSGVGSVPERPQMPHAEAIDCSSVRVRWGKADGRGFPVHKYRVFRRGGASGSAVGTSGTVVAFPTPPKNVVGGWDGEGDAWVLVYEGSATEFLDQG